MFGAQLRQQRTGAADWPLGDGGKKVQEQRQPDKAGFNLAIAAGSIDQVGDCGKAGKADAQRHGHRAPAVQHPAQQAVILEKCQNTQHADHAKTQKCGFVGPISPAKAAAAQVGEHRQRNGNRQHGRHGQRIKHPRSRQQKHRLHAHRQMQVNGSHNHQKCTVLQALQPHERNLQTNLN